MTDAIDLRPSPIAGQWYPGDKKHLADQVDQYLDAAKMPHIDGDIVAVMAPHAGHDYSGSVAGYAFAALRGLNPDLVVVISPMHHPYYEPLLTSAHQAYNTPLGPVLVHQDALQALDELLSKQLGFSLTPIANDMEHSLEIELPFLQRALGNQFLLLPIMMRAQSDVVARGLGYAIAQLVTEHPVMQDQTAILVASTDLSHFYPQHVANTLDREVLRQVEAFDPSGVIQVEEQGKGFACGRGAIAAVLWASERLGANHVQILNYGTSGDATGDYDSVVGYGAAVITRR